MMSCEGLVRTRLDDPLSLFRPSETPILVIPRSLQSQSIHCKVECPGVRLRAGCVKNVKCVKYVNYVNDSHLAAN